MAVARLRTFRALSPLGARPCLGPVRHSRLFTSQVAKSDEDIAWIQDLLNETEGGGYIVSKAAGLIGHRVAWGDMDYFRHVNNVVYLKWFETARVNMFRSYAKSHPESGMDEFMSASGVGPIIRSVQLAWRYPVTFPDRVTVVHKLKPLKDADRFELQGVVVSHNARKVAARISEVIVTVDYDKGGVKAPIPEPIKRAFEARLEEQEQYK